MMTVITNVTLSEGTEPEWDRVMAERLANAAGCDGWIRGEILMRLDGMNKRLIVGTWRSRADWEAWHQDPTFTETSARLDAVQTSTSGPQWHEVVTDVTSQRALKILKAAKKKAGATLTQFAARLRASGGRLQLRGGRTPL